MRDWKPEEIETVAEDFLKCHGKWDGERLMLEYSIDRVGFTLMPVPGLSEVAEAFVPARRPIIFIDEEQYNLESNRSRFTLAEELAHILIHRPMFEGRSLEEITAMRDALTDAQYVQIEREAKLLASALLMRRQRYTERFGRLYEAQKHRCGNEASTLRYVFRQQGLAFMVSQHAAALRALNLDLIDQPQLNEWNETRPEYHC